MIGIAFIIGSMKVQHFTGTRQLIRERLLREKEISKVHSSTTEKKKDEEKKKKKDEGKEIKKGEKKDEEKETKKGEKKHEKKEIKKSEEKKTKTVNSSVYDFFLGIYRVNF